MSQTHIPHPHHHHHHAKSIVQEFSEKKVKQASGAAAYARAVRRYGFETHSFIGKKGVVFKKRKPQGGGTGDSSGTGTSEVPAEDIQDDLEYVVPVTIGTPGVTLQLDFDTGSSDLWVWSSEISAKSSKGHTIYNPKNSSTAKVLSGETWKISYGDGSSASGDVYTDTIHLGSIAIPGQAVELASQLSSSFLTENGSDGLLGLAFPSLNTVTPKIQNTPVQNLIEQKIIPQPIFTVMLDKGDSNGFYTFGTIDSAKAGVTDDDIVYTPVDSSQGFWMFNSESATINGTTVARSGNTAIADTGTTLCLLDDNTVDQIYKTITGAKVDNNQGGYVYPSNAEIPTVQLAVGGQLFTINANNFAYGPAGQGFTFGGIQSRGDNPFDIFGDVFLKNVYVVFDQGNVRIGMAQRSST